MNNYLDIIIHFDKYLSTVVSENSNSIYFILLITIFCETGLVITPFLPGDSLLFTVGALAALDALNIWLLLITACIAATAGDSVNYAIGRSIGRSLNEKAVLRFIKKEFLLKAKEFYIRHGGMAIVLSRFVPIIRTFAPFIAGIGEMSYRKFIIYNVVGGVVWVCLFLFGGLCFGNLPFVKKHFMLVVIAVVAISVLPAVAGTIKENLKKECKVDLKNKID